jgi:hypothetical protein
LCFLCRRMSLRDGHKTDTDLSPLTVESGSL